MEAVAARGTGATLVEISRELDLHPSTAFHLLRTLVALGYLSQDGATRAYRVGLKVFQLATAGEERLADVAESFVAELARESRETSHLAVHERGRAVVISKVDGSGPLVVSERVGTRRPLHCTAIGKALLAYLPEPDALAFLGNARLERYTPKTLTERGALEKELVRVRERGYAVDDEEFSEGVRCLAAPVFNAGGQLVAALGVSGPTIRVTRQRMEELAALVANSARRLSQRLGADAKREGGGRPGRRPRGGQSDADRR
jgi:IclR family acetate operon transcriptional repressor